MAGPRLAEDEAIFRDSVYEFADREIRPHVREMDEHAKIPPQLIESLFKLGYLGLRSSFVKIGSNVWGDETWIPMVLMEVYIFSDDAVGRREHVQDRRF